MRLLERGTSSGVEGSAATICEIQRTRQLGENMQNSLLCIRYGSPRSKAGEG